MEYLNIILKTSIFFLLVMVIIRLLGKREVGEISVFDLVVLLLIADIATLGIEHDWKMVLLCTVSLITLLVLQKLIAVLTIRFPKLRGMVDYKPSVIIYQGKLNLKEMKKQSYTMDDLITQAREKGVMDIIEIQLAILESSGELSVYEKKDYDKIVLPVLVSGSFVVDNLNYFKLKEEDIKNYLKTKKLDYKRVHYLSSDGKNYFMLEAL